MKKGMKRSEEAQELRRRAEGQYHERNAGEPESRHELDLKRLVHELGVHQIELELQNEELMQVRAELEALLRQYMDLYDFAPLGYFTLARDGTILQVNLRGATLLNVERSTLINQNFYQFVSIENRTEFQEFLRRVFESSTRETSELTLLKGLEPLYCQIEAQISENQQGCRAVVMDITQRKKIETELRTMNIHDALTGLYNRAYFDEMLARLEHGRQFPISIIMADLDGLKYINDHLGHVCGDTALRRVAQIMVSTFRIEDIISRFGGDEFTILLMNTGEDEAKKVLHRLQRALEEENREATGPPLHLSLGLSTADKTDSLHNVLQVADERMYIDKRRNKYDAPAVP